MIRGIGVNIALILPTAPLFKENKFLQKLHNLQKTNTVMYFNETIYAHSIRNFMTYYYVRTSRFEAIEQMICDTINLRTICPIQ